MSYPYSFFLDRILLSMVPRATVRAVRRRHGFGGGGAIDGQFWSAAAAAHRWSSFLVFF